MIYRVCSSIRQFTLNAFEFWSELLILFEKSRIHLILKLKISWSWTSSSVHIFLPMRTLDYQPFVWVWIILINFREPIITMLVSNFIYQIIRSQCIAVDERRFRDFLLVSVVLITEFDVYKLSDPNLIAIISHIFNFDLVNKLPIHLFKIWNYQHTDFCDLLLCFQIQNRKPWSIFKSGSVFWTTNLLILYVVEINMRMDRVYIFWLYVKLEPW